MGQQVITLKTQSGGGSYTITLYADYGTPNTANRTISVSTYATINSTTAACGTGGPSFIFNLNGSQIGTVDSIKNFGSHGDYNWGEYRTPTFNKTLFYDSEGNVAANFELAVNAGSNVYGPISGTALLNLSIPSIGVSAIYPEVAFTTTYIENAFEGYPIAGYTSVGLEASAKNWTAISANYSTPGLTKHMNFQVNGETVIMNAGVLPSSPTNYIVEFAVEAVSKTEHTSRDTTTETVYGYKLPTYGYQTYTTRCDSTGRADGLGEYGKLYLTWDITQIGTNNLNIAPIVMVNDERVNATEGSIADGYFTYVFPLSTSTTGNLSITLTDKISTNTITSLFISKANMAISLFDDGNDVGVSFGQMATEKGFHFFTNNGDWPITIDGKPLSGGNNGIFVQTNATIPADMKNGDILIVYEV